MAVVDTGTNQSVPHVLHALRVLGLERDAVELVFVTHVHLDHAGGAGLLLSELPRARALAHPRAVPHLLDPSRLVEATRAVYGEQRFEALYGTLLPVDPARLSPTRDLQPLSLGKSEFQVLHTPGHALHHHVLHDREAAAVFTGDTFGLSYRLLDSEQGPFILPTTTPSQFDPEQLTTSIDRILGLSPKRLYLTHFGGVSDVPRLGAALKAQVQRCVEIARRHAGAPDRLRAIHDELRALWLDLLRAHGTRCEPQVLDDWLDNDLALNAQGLVAWLERDARGRGGSA